MFNIINNILELIFPPKCGICGKIEKQYICDKCQKELESCIYEKNSDDIFHLFTYTGIVRKKLIEYKFEEKSYLYKMFCEILVKNEKFNDFFEKYDIIIPVPIHNKRKRTRGYNQSELIAKELCKKSAIKMYNDVLIKKVNNTPQSTLGKLDRIKNVQNVYKLENVQKIEKRNVLIIDDIYTTGATVNECVKLLKEAKAEKVGVLTIAKD